MVHLLKHFIFALGGILMVSDWHLPLLELALMYNCTVVQNSNTLTYSMCTIPQFVLVLWLCLISCLSGRWKNRESQTKAILSNPGKWKRSQDAPKEWKVFSKSISLTNKHCLKIGSWKLWRIPPYKTFHLIVTYTQHLTSSSIPY